MPSRARQVYLFLLFAAVLALAVLSAALAEGLPYGAFAKHAFAVLLALAAFPAWGLLRCHIRSRNLSTGELFRMERSEIPREPDHTFLGLAFPWKTDHAERLYRMVAHGLDAPEKVQSLFGGNVSIHGLGAGEEKPLFISDKRRTHHVLITGSPGEGKTRATELMILQAIEAGDPIAVVDPKGDTRLIDLVHQACGETGRANAFRIVALPWPSLSASYNPLATFATPSDIADRLIGLFPPPSGESEAFQGFQWGATKAAVQAMYLLGIPITIARVLRYLRDLSDLATSFVKAKFPGVEARGLGDFVEKYEAAVASGTLKRSPEFDDLLAYVRLDPGYYMKMVASFLPQLERLSAGPKRELLSPEPAETRREILTWQAIDRQKLVVYFHLSNLQGEASAAAVGKMLLLDLQSYVAARYNYNLEQAPARLSVFVDEAHHMVSKPFLNVLAEGRGAGVACVLSTQTTSQFEEALRSRAVVDEILTQNFCHIQFQTRNPREARDFSDLVGERQMRVVGESHSYEPAFFTSGWRDVEDFRAKHTQSIQMKDAALVPTWAISALPTFHYFARMGGRLYKGRIPLLPEPTSSFTKNLQKEVRGKGIAA